MNRKLPLSLHAHRWLNLLAVKAKINPTCSGQHWLLHLTPCHPAARTTTLRIRWSGAQWQLLTISNASDWLTMDQTVDELCFDTSRNCFWRCKAGPVTSLEQPSILANFLAQLERICTQRGFVIKSDPLPQEEVQDAQATNSR